jgi:alkylation response protein AidB-like acyl-CoA dehydrogenase
MHFAPNDTQRGVVETARDFATSVLAPRAAELDRVGGFPHDNLKQAAERGLLGVALPRDLGGLEAGAVAYALSVIEMAGACAGTTVALCVSNMVAEVVAEFGTAAQREKHVPLLCAGDYAVGAFALSEPGAGSDAGGIRCRARKVDGGWVLDGSKLWITSGSDAGLYVVWARTNDSPGARGVSAFLITPDIPGVTRGKPEHKMGLNGSTTTGLELDGAEVGDDALLDEEGRGFRIAMMALDGGRIGIACGSLGVGFAATETARRFVAEQMSRGRRLADAQAIQWMLADSTTQLEAARLLTLRAAWLKQNKKPYTSAASMAKVYASERAWQACDRAIQIIGSRGYTRELSVERNYRDVRVAMIYEGTSEIQRLVIARDIMRRFAAE